MSAPQTRPIRPAAGQWVEDWLSRPRHAVYIAAAGGDPEHALALCEWNTQIGAAFLRDLAHIEVAVRNAYDRALERHWPGTPHWTSRGAVVFAPLIRNRNGRHVDINRRLRETLDHALRDAGGMRAPAGKVIAELTFGFWRYLSSSAHEKTLWVPALHHAFPPGTDRQRDVDGVVGRLHALRNRAAHHEQLMATDVPGRLSDIVGLAKLIDPKLSQYLAATTSVPRIAVARP